MNNSNSRQFIVQDEEVSDEDDSHSFEVIKRNELKIAEKIVKIAKKKMLDMLAEFKNESGELRRLKEQKNEEQLMLNRLVKNEVIDMADRVEEI